MKRVLFICTHNSARSRMAEAYLNLLGRGEYEARSAGMAPREINPYVAEALREDGVAVPEAGPQSVFEVFRKGELYDFAVTVCEEAEASCPIFPGVTHRLHLPFPDPAAFTGTREEILARTREVRDAVKQKVREFIDWCDAGCEAPLNGEAKRP